MPMFYLSQLISKPIFKGPKKLGQVLDLVVAEKDGQPVITHLLFKQHGQKKLLATTRLQLKDKGFITQGELELRDFNPKAFYLNEDLLDKQVIDVTGKRLVRVNDILLKLDTRLVVTGIDIGFSGILRRLGLPTFHLKTISLPWNLIEAFDYQTGDVKIRLSQDRLNTFHPSELADILEEAGSKERMGILEMLDAQIAADAIEEANEETQQSIIENLSSGQLKEIINQMPVSEIADLFGNLDKKTTQKIYHYLGQEKSQKLKNLLVFADNTAGGLMEDGFCLEGKITIKEARAAVYQQAVKLRKYPDTHGELDKASPVPETFQVLKDDLFLGTVLVKDLASLPAKFKLAEAVSSNIAVGPSTHFPHILKLFAKYNLRSLPVIDKDKHILGVVSIDAILHNLEEEDNEKPI